MLYMLKTTAISVEESFIFIGTVRLLSHFQELSSV